MCGDGAGREGVFARADTHPHQPRPIPSSSRPSLPTQSTGVEFPQVATFWAGSPARCLGATVRAKKIAIVNVKVYAVALYVEAERAARELGLRSRGGFFAGNGDGDFCAALVDGAFHKALRIDLVRDVEGAVFYEALEAAMGPRVRLVGEGAALDAFGAFFGGRKLAKGTAILMLWRPSGAVEVATCADGAGRAPAAFAAPDAAELTVDAPGLGRALFETYLGEASVVPAGRKAWADGARALLETEEVKRGTR